MSNLPILHFTLGALVGLPLGWWLGRMFDLLLGAWYFLRIMSRIEASLADVEACVSNLAAKGASA